MLSAIPRKRPITPLLDQIDQPEQLRALPRNQLESLADELRAFLLYSVGQTGGHFGAGLGAVELTLALHYCFDTPRDHLIWDVGHQSYPHKVITGRREALLTIRQLAGLAPFPKREESLHDSFGTGHSSTSISAALGMALAHRLKGEPQRTVAIIGDGALTGGMAFEALNHAAHTNCDLLVILNDNDMSISPNEGGLATYLAKNLRGRSDGETTAALFEALEFHYSGPINGHDFDQLLPALERLRQAKGPQFLHVRTLKGKGFAPAERDPVGYHALTKLPAPEETQAPKGPTYAKLFGSWLCQQAENDPRLVAITPAMSEGSGMVDFANRFPERFFDVAIAEQHAITLAAGLACEGMKPVVAIYSTFLQRGYDQLIHDVALQNLDLLLAIDRAGLVGEDGPTHHGSFDLSFLACIPNLLLMTPSDEAECQRLLATGYQHPGPACVRYPRGPGAGTTPLPHAEPVTIGKSRLLREGSRAALLNFGALLPAAREAAESLDLTLVDMRFVKPLDETRIKELCSNHSLLVTLEDNALIGGAGSLVDGLLSREGIDTRRLSLGIPDKFIEHGSVSELRQQLGLDAQGIAQQIRQRLATSN